MNTLSKVATLQGLNRLRDMNVLRVASAVQDGETVIIGTQTYEVDTTVIAGIVSGHVRVDCSGGGTTAALGTLSLTAKPSDTETVVVNGKTYTFQTTLTNVDGHVLIGATAETAAANLIAAINLGAGAGTTYATAMTQSAAVSAAAGVNVAATGTLTSDNTAPSDGDTVTIDSKVYTFKTALTPTEGEVLINTTADAALLNLIRAINHTGTPNTDYKCAAAHPTVSAAASVTSHHFLITALTANASGNLIATTETSSHLSFGATTLTGGITKDVLTALIPGTVGNAITTTETLGSGSFGGSTLASGVDPTADEFVDALVTAINGNYSDLFSADDISDNEIVIRGKKPGVIAASCTETLAGSNNGWAAATSFGGFNLPAAFTNTFAAERAATATEVALLTMHFYFPFTPKTAQVQVRSSAGALKAFDGTLIVNSGGRVDVNSTGSTNIAAGDLVVVLAVN